MNLPSNIYWLIANVVFLSSLCCCAVHDPKHLEFTEREDYPKTHEVYQNEEAYQQANSDQCILKVDLSDQRAKLVNKHGITLIDTPVTTGKSSKRTPKGEFCISSKIRHKRSNIFGRLYRGRRMVYGGDRRRYRGSYTRFVGSSLPYWMRLTQGGIGVHGSSGIRRHPASNGCIRVPHKTVPKLYTKLDKGSLVSITE